MKQSEDHRSMSVADYVRAHSEIERVDLLWEYSGRDGRRTDPDMSMSGSRADALALFDAQRGWGWESAPIDHKHVHVEVEGDLLRASAYNPYVVEVAVSELEGLL